ncbi:GntR family transcriptional regulator [Mitsuaria sp. GD03876]|uniref:GntR family transcriptional regulator n=1 Tax=Mitsuaria sp. GD03876 TaxID=2975399 RepID=UPI00244AED16|nr:GntR family transcriptional regulator [Mitsuaria sp. GD03876]MDH0863138.1 GntR family transcriptional regulator [Mitsuaria sp. GD03876]
MARFPYPINTPTYLRLRDQIRDDIEDGCWQLGQHLTLQELSAHYEVSNVPVREALLQLQGEGMVDMRMNRGAVVREVDARFIGEYFDVREALWSMLIAQACRNPALRDGQPFQRAWALLPPVEEAARAGRVHDLMAADELLQQELGRLADHGLAFDLQASRGRLLEALRRTRLELWAPELEALPVQGRAMLQAIAHGDPATGVEAVRRHVAALRTYALRLLKLPSVPRP